MNDSDSDENDHDSKSDEKKDNPDKSTTETVRLLTLDVVPKNTPGDFQVHQPTRLPLHSPKLQAKLNRTKRNRLMAIIFTDDSCRTLFRMTIATAVLKEIMGLCGLRRNEINNCSQKPPRH
jgi:hypothetical protein